MRNSVSAGTLLEKDEDDGEKKNIISIKSSFRYPQKVVQRLAPKVAFWSHAIPLVLDAFEKKDLVSSAGGEKNISGWI